jgi:hypothetical protein
VSNPPTLFEGPHPYPYNRLSLFKPAFAAIYGLSSPQKNVISTEAVERPELFRLAVVIDLWWVFANYKGRRKIVAGSNPEISALRSPSNGE